MNSNDVVSGLLTGVISAVCFNPIDKIIFSCSIKGESLFDRRIFKDLFKGSFNTICTRIVTSGLYFSYLDHYASATDNKAQVALMTSLVCAVTNPIQLVKFNSWYCNRSIYQSFIAIRSTYGLRGFAIGVVPLISRDFIFNYVYISNREKNNHFMNLAAITSGLVLSTPFNLIKNKKYASNESYGSIFRNFKCKQLGIGLIVVRSCLSFYGSQLIYDNVKTIVEP